MKSLRSHKNQAWLNIGTMLYGLFLTFVETSLSIIEFPAKFGLILACLVIPLINLILLIKGCEDYSRWGTVLITTIWSTVGVLYHVHPTSNSGTILAVLIIGFSLLSLYDGRGGE